jgi:hypothetical protein
VSKDGPGTSSRFDDFNAAKTGSSAGFFRGAELPRLLVLLALMAVGWALVWKYFDIKGGPPEEPDPATRVALPKVEPDRSPAFDSVTDRTPIGLRDMAAYDLLLKRARGTAPAELARISHGDIYFTDLWERPRHYRGVPIHLLGTARRIISYESKLSPRGRLYEAWISTHESQGYPYVCIFEDPPGGMPVGPDLSERVVFNGYFLKEMRYLSGKDVERAAPMLVGKIGWTPGRSAEKRGNSVFWMALIVGIMFAISLFRWINGLRRSLSRPSLASSLGQRPTDEIAPDDLAHWVESVQEGEEPRSEPEEDRR